jgi:hypothetical protein
MTAVSAGPPAIRIERTPVKSSLPAALLVALLVSIFVNVVALSFKDGGGEDFLRRAEQAEADVRAQTETVAVLTRRLESLERRKDRRPRRGDDDEVESAAAPAEGEGEVPLAPDGTAYVSTKELEEAVKQALEKRGVQNWDPATFTPAQPKSLEEVALEMGLSAGEEARLQIILRETEDEALDIFFPGQKIEAVKQQLAGAKEDPDQLSQMAQQLAMRGVSNFGRLATLEKRRNMKIKQALGDEKAKEFRGKRVKPFYGDDIEDLLGDIFD